ncbi:MAG: ABC transporter permease [Patescibacteria group bacterium]
MHIRDLLQTSTESLRRNTSRSLLTILGIVIGIAAVILMLSLGQGAQGYVLGQVADLGSDLIFVEAGSGDTEGGPPSPFVEQTITLDDAEALERLGPFSFVSSTLITSSSVSYAENSSFTQVSGVDEHQLNIFPADLVSGRFIDADDVRSHSRVAVLGYDIAKELFGDQDPLGESIKIKNLATRVIGVLEPQGSRFFTNLDEQIYIPVTTAQRELLGVDYVNYISARAMIDVESAKEDARAILRDSHRIDNSEQDLAKDDFLVSSQSDAVEVIGAVGFALTLLLASIAAISLLVGGIGIMNIMLVSVTERTREIGLRKAIGATEKEVLQQFLLEAVMLTLVGGILGIIIGTGGSVLASLVISQFVDGWNLVIPPQAIVLSVVVSSAVGVIFGYYPAKRAARLDPIEALRYE